MSAGNGGPQARVQELVSREALYLDRRMWDEWLALYASDAVFWVPAWADENQPTSDPETQVSLIYHTTRAALEDRVWRLRSERSAASVPLLRTAHVVGSVLLETAQHPDMLEAHAAWSCHVFNPKRKLQHVFFGRYEYSLRAAGGELKIARKKILLLNDYIPTMIDFYCV